jgi:hypothetical protein
MQTEDEEMLQAQPEEEELQMQPESGGVVQRFSPIDWIKNKKSSNITSGPSLGTGKSVGETFVKKGQDDQKKIENKKPTGGDLRHEIRKKRKAMGMSSISSQKSKDTHAENLGKLESTQAHQFKKITAKGIDSGKFKRATQRDKLIKTLKNPSSTPEQMKAAEDQLRTFHKSGAFKKNPATIALEQRKKSLKNAARMGDEKAAALYSKENPSFMTKAKGFYGKHKDTIGKVMGFLGKGLGIGGGDKEKDKSEAKGGGGGGDGGYAVIISQLMQENKMLKEKLGQK